MVSTAKDVSHDVIGKQRLYSIHSNHTGVHSATCCSENEIRLYAAMVPIVERSQAQWRLWRLRFAIQCYVVMAWGYGDFWFLQKVAIIASGPQHSPDIETPAFVIEDGWILSSTTGRRIGWLPATRRPFPSSLYTSRGTYLAIGTASGGVTILDLAQTVLGQD